MSSLRIELCFWAVEEAPRNSRDRRMRRGKKGAEDSVFPLPLEATPMPAKGTLATNPRGQRECPRPVLGRTTDLGEPLHQNRALGPPGDRRL